MFRRVLFAALVSASVSPAAASTAVSDFRPQLAIFSRVANGAAAIGDLDCTEQARVACTLRYGSVGILVGSLPDKKTIEFVKVICAKDCEPDDFALAADLSIRILTPHKPSNKYDAWMPLIKASLADKQPHSTFVGSTKVTVTTDGWLDLMAWPE